MAIPVKNNFCIAPFSQLTLDPLGWFSPCPEIGGRPWIEPDANAINMWSSQSLTDLRQSFAENQKHSVCTRCWEQEQLGKTSLRKTLFVSKISGGAKFKKGQLSEWLSGQYTHGPKQINLMVSNKCNLRCRYCRVVSSVTYNIEGKKYIELNPEQGKEYYNEKLKPVEFSQQQIEQIFQISNNLTRLEFYGGEPLLDVATLDLLQKYIDAGMSKNITLFYNTNGVNEIKPIHWELWNQFKSIEFNFSVDDIENRYSYIRHPAVWTDLLSNIDKIRNKNWDIPVQLTAISTVGVLNVYYVPELLTELKKLNLPVHINTVNNPHWYDIKCLPDTIKCSIVEKLQQSTEQSKIKFLYQYLSQEQNLQHWEDFKFWTKTKDEYRKENFATTYPEFYEKIKLYDDFYV